MDTRATVQLSATYKVAIASSSLIVSIGHLTRPLQLGLARRRRLLQLDQFLADGEEAKVQLTTKVVRQSDIVVVDAQVSGADLAHPQLLLLVRRCGHGGAVFVLCLDLLAAQLVDLLHQLHAVLHLAGLAQRLRLGQLLANLLGKAVHGVGLLRHLGGELLLRLLEPLLGRVRATITVGNEGLQVFHGLDVVVVVARLRRALVICAESQVMHFGTLTEIHASGRQDVVRTAVEQEGLADPRVRELELPLVPVPCRSH